MRIFCILIASLLLVPACAPRAASTDEVSAAAPARTAPDDEAADEPDQRRCRSTDDAHVGDNVGISARLCVSDVTPRVGQAVTFTVRARDPDARLFGITGCFPNDLVFGDSDMWCEGGPVCAAGSGHDAVREEGTVDAKRTHTYVKPGRYTARLELQSGSQCPHPYASSAKLRLMVRVHS